MQDLIDLYGDVVVTILSIVFCLVVLSMCIELYRMGLVRLFDSLMYGGAA